MSSITPAPVGKSLFESRTVWSILAALFFYTLPALLSRLGVSTADQGSVITALHQIIAPLAMIAAILFHAISTKPVTSILPQGATPPAVRGLLIFFLLAGACVLASPLTACKTTSSARVTQARADAIAWASLQSIAETIDGLALAHVIHGRQAATIADWLSRAEAFLTAADAAYQHGDNATAATNVALATGLITALIQIGTHPDQALPAPPPGASAPPPPTPSAFRAPGVPLALRDLRVAVVVAHSQRG